MKKRLMFFVMFLVFVSFSIASIDVRSSDVKSTYNLGETLKGSIDLKISRENVTLSVNSNFGDKISLFDFIDKSSSNYTCDPEDCLSEYISSSPSTDKAVNIVEGKSSYFGFVFEGPEIEVSSIVFDIRSDFGTGSNLPLKFNFVEGASEWKFGNFINSYSAGNYGCYSSASRQIGPFIQNPDNSYCELIEMTDTAAVMVGADLSGSDNKRVRMELYDSGDSLIDSCNYFPGNSSGGCLIRADSGEILESGNYSVCIGSDVATNYRVYKDTSGRSCGYIYENGLGNSSVDYAVYAKTALYGNSSGLNSSSMDFEDLAEVFDDYINSRYGRDCEDKCIVPVEVIGVNQTLNIFNISIRYDSSSSGERDDHAYGLRVNPAKISYNGTLDLGGIEFNVNSEGNYILSAGTKKLFEKYFRFNELPNIISISPLTVPAGIQTEFSVGLGVSGQSILGTYEFDFGNNVKRNSSSNKINYTYGQIGTYNLLVKFKFGSNVVEKSFVINVVSPVEALRESVAQKRSSYNDLKTAISAMPSWYGSEVSNKIGLSSIEQKIIGLEKKLNQTTPSNSSNTSFSSLISEALGLKVPNRIEVDTIDGVKLVSLGSELNLAPIIELDDFNPGSALQLYKGEVIKWQDGNINPTISREDIYSSNEDGSRTFLGSAYFLDILSYSTEIGKLVISSPESSLKFKGSYSPESVSGFTLLNVGPGSRQIFEFFSPLSGGVSFYVSPSIKDLAIGEIDVCNYNQICDSDLGEDYSNCRSDCKPLAKALFYAIFAILFILIIYTWLQVWYTYKYEGFLFPDRKQLYNLLMFVSNAIARGNSYSQIASDLEKQGWSKERVSYVIAKARGKRTGMLELIPITKISNYLRNRKAIKNFVSNNHQFANSRVSSTVNGVQKT